MKTRNIELMTAEIDAHRAADLLVQGTYFDEDTGQGCFIADAWLTATMLP